MNGDVLESQLPRRPFGIIVPHKTGVKYVHQAGGVAIRYLQITGAYLPLGRPLQYEGNPEWFEGYDTTDVTDIPVEEMSEEERSRLPEDVVDYGGFPSARLYQSWLDESPHYGQVDLLSELERYNYYAYNTTRDDPVLDRWNDEKEIWSAIDEDLRFEYDEYDYNADPLNALPTDAAEPVEGLRWIRITEAKTVTEHDIFSNGEEESEALTRKLAYWPDDLQGQVVALVYPNCD